MAIIKASTTFVDSVPLLIRLLDRLHSINPPLKPADPPNLYCDLEGEKLGRRGTIAIFSIFLTTDPNQVYLIDVYSMKHGAFFMSNSKGTSLKTVLESKTVPKAFFDIRNDADALFSLFGIKVSCVHDLQLMELASRPKPPPGKQRLNSLASCIEKDLVISAQQKMTFAKAKEAGQRMWDPRKGGSYSVFRERPLRLELIKYCSGDVVMLPCLWKHYMSARQLGKPDYGIWRREVWAQTVSRINQSQQSSYDPQGDNRGLGPGWHRSEYMKQMKKAWQRDVSSAIQGRGKWVEKAFGQFEAE